MDHWQTPVNSVQTYLHPLRRVAKPLRYYFIRICHGLFSHYTTLTVARDMVGLESRQSRLSPLLLVDPVGFEPTTP